MRTMKDKLIKIAFAAGIVSLLLGVGALGGFTAFSAFSLETVLMIQQRDWGQAAAYVTASVGLSVAALMAGVLLARRLFA